ncbi:MAG: glucosaminidase domain-containing protein [Thiotrichales bacterium]|nr:MAG: glucosaminidase domain-containing protein [Thiotrichales bacterium]
MKLPARSLLYVALTTLSGFQHAYSDTAIIRTVESKNYNDVLQLFNEIGYTAEKWQAGIREVPRIEITEIPQRWQKVAQTIPISDKKNIFFRLTGSGILQANEKILFERQRLLEAIEKNDIDENEWLAALAVKYRVIKQESDKLDNKDLIELKKRVDIVPPSLALAQAAEESGWGTSRFAVQGNSLFGQWDFSGKGIKPKEQRAELGNYGIAAFESPQASIEAYMLNLNTHRAYERMRQKRAVFRQQNKVPKGWDLAKTLDKYSERGIDYVKSLHSIMSYNKLNDADQAYLWDKGKIVVSPAP